MGTLISDLVLTLLSYVAENERENIRQRQAAAKARGVRFGRPRKELPENFEEVSAEWREKKLTLRQAAEQCNMPMSTFYDKARERKKGQEG